jgi:hypothetical protein
LRSRSPLSTTFGGFGSNQTRDQISGWSFSLAVHLLPKQRERGAWTSACEIRNLTLEEALRLLFLYAEKDPARSGCSLPAASLIEALRARY